MLPQVNPLPGPEQQFSIAKGHRHGTARKHASCMRGHIIVPFGIVLIRDVTVRRPALCERFKIDANQRVGILGNDHRTTRVLREDVGDATAYPAGTDQAGDVGGYLRRAALTRVNLKSVLVGQV